MKVLFVGIGSIGTRHLRNLHTVAKERGLELDELFYRGLELHERKLVVVLNGALNDTRRARLVD